MGNQKKPSEHQKKSKQFNSYIRFSNLAFQMVAVIGLATWIGVKIDQRVAIKFPLFTITLALTALIGVIFWLVRAVSDKSD